MGLDGTLTDWFTFFCNVIGIGILGRWKGNGIPPQIEKEASE
jgi:hypothetical protein